MTITSLGTPAGVHAASNAVTGSWGTGQDVTAGTLLVAVVAITTSAATTQAPTMTSGWALLASENNRGAAGTARANVFVYTKTSTAGDTAPTFTGTSGTTNSSYMMLLDLSGANTTTPLDISATYDSGTASSTVAGTATTAGTPAASGEYAISVFAQERAASTATWSDSGTGDGTTDFSVLHGGNDGGGTTSTGQTYIGVLASPASHTINDAGAFSTATTAYGAGLITVIALAPAPVPTSGPVLQPLSQPAAVRVVWLRTGLAQASLIPPAVTAPSVTPAKLYPLTQPARGCRPVPPRGRVYRNAGAPLRNPAAGPVFRLPYQPARIPIPATFSKGRAYGNKGAPVANPTVGPVFRQATQPIRGRVPQIFSKGRISGNRGAPLRNPTRGPVFRPLAFAVAGRRPLPPRGCTLTMGVLPGQAVLIVLAPVYPLTQPTRGRILPPPRGHTTGSRGAPVRNPATGPVFRQATAPARARQPLPPRGRAFAGGRGAAVFSPATGPKVRPLTQPVRFRITAPPRGRTSSTPPYAAPRNPGQGTQQQPLAYPAGVRVSFLRVGYGAGGRGAPVSSPLPPAPAVTVPALHSPVQAKLPRPLLPGRAATMAMLPLPQAPALGPVFRLPAQPVQARQPLLPRGRTSGNPGAPVHNPPAPVTAQSPPLTQPVHAKLPYPFLPGRAATMAMLPLPSVPTAGPAFHLPAQPARARQPLSPKGRTSGNPGAPVRNPPPPPAPFPPARGPVRARQPLPSRGRTASSRTAAAVHAGPPTYPLQAPVRARIPQNWSRGRAYGSIGAPVRNPAPAAPAPAYPLHQPVRTRITLPPRGHTTGSRGAPVRNPTRGPQPRPLSSPVRGQPAFPFLHGRAAGSGGAPVTFPPIPPSSAAGLLTITPAGRQAAILSIRLAMAATTDVGQLAPAAVTASDPAPYRRPEIITAAPGTARIRPAGLVTLDPPGPLRT